MVEQVRPASTEELCSILADATQERRAVELRGGGSKSTIGCPGRDATVIDMTGFTGIIDYDPRELVLTVGAGTPLAEVQDLIAGERQMLAFEPFDYARLLGGASGKSTIGGVVAAGVSGSRRISSGATRDHLLGFEAVSGRGDAFVGGGRVVKNVTGYDLPKLMAGSWGRLAALTAVTLKVLPQPRTQATIVAHGLDDDEAVQAMARAMGSPADVTAAAHLPEQGLTVLRLEGFEPSVAARAEMLRAILGGRAELLSNGDDCAIWDCLLTLSCLGRDDPLWRISVAPSRGPQVFRALEPLSARWVYDWAGGLVWVTLPADADQQMVRRTAIEAGGHATLVRASEELRSCIPALQPEAPGLSALSDRVRKGFDPANILSPGRFGGAHAH